MNYVCAECGHRAEGVERSCARSRTALEGAATVKTGGSLRWLKIGGILGALIVVIIVVALLVGGTGGPGGPEQTIRSFYREAERLNAIRQADLMVQEHRAIVAGTLELTYAMIDSLSVSDLKITITSRTEYSAEATAEYDWSYRGKDGSTYSRSGEVDHFKLVRVSGKWLIQETDFFYG